MAKNLILTAKHLIKEFKGEKKDKLQFIRGENTEGVSAFVAALESGNEDGVKKYILLVLEHKDFLEDEKVALLAAERPDPL